MYDNWYKLIIKLPLIVQLWHSSSLPSQKIFFLTLVSIIGFGANRFGFECTNTNILFE